MNNNLTPTGVISPDAPIVEGDTDFGARAPALPYILYYWRTIAQFRWMILGIISVCLVLGVIITLLTPPLYTAKVRIEIDREQKHITDVSRVQGDQGGQGDQTNEFYVTQYALLQARPLAERIVRSLDLANSSDFFVAHGIALTPNGLGGDPGDRNAREKKAAQLLLSHIAVEPVKDSKLVDVKYTSRSPEISARIAQQWVKTFTDSRLDQQYASTADARRFLEERLATMKEKLEQSERQSIAYSVNQGLERLGHVVTPDGRTADSQTVLEMTLAARVQALALATQARVAAETRLRGDEGEVSLDASVVALRQARTQLAVQREQILVQHEPTYPAAQELNAQIAQMDRDIKTSVRRIQENAQQNYREAHDQEQELVRQVSDLRRQLGQQQHAAVEYNIYQREADTNRQLYDALLQRYKEIGINGTIGASQVSVVEPAVAPNAPSSPNLLKNMAFALLLGLVLSGAMVFAIEHIGQSIHDPEVLAKLLDVPVLGHVPLLEDGNIREALTDSRSLLYESYVNLRTALTFATSQGIPSSLMITSSRPKEGKSTTALGLSLVIKRMGRSVLLIDADMRNPSQVTDDHAPGLSNYLAGDENWMDKVREGEVGGISVLPSGPKPPNAAELLTELRLTELLRQAAGHYDHVIIDTPPIIDLADAPLIAGAVSACLLVVEADGPSQRAVHIALNRLLMSKVKIVGALLTKQQMRYGYGYAYGYGYGYGYGRKRVAEAGDGTVA